MRNLPKRGASSAIGGETIIHRKPKKNMIISLTSS